MIKKYEASVHRQLITAMCILFYMNIGNLISMGSQNGWNVCLDNVVTTKRAENAETMQASVDSCPKQYF